MLEFCEEECTPDVTLMLARLIIYLAMMSANSLQLGLHCNVTRHLNLNQ